MNYKVWLVLLYMLIGLLLFEWAYRRVRRIRMRVEEADRCFPAWRRVDVQNWSRWKFYPAAVTLLPARLFIFVMGFAVMTVFSKILYLCNTKKLYE